MGTRGCTSTRCGRRQETEEEQDLRNERIKNPFILRILLWLRGETAQWTEGEQDLRNDRIRDLFIPRILLSSLTAIGGILTVPRRKKTGPAQMPLLELARIAAFRAALVT
jgi:hypothetical protein